MAKTNSDFGRSLPLAQTDEKRRLESNTMNDFYKSNDRAGFSADPYRDSLVQTTGERRGLL